MRVSALQFSPAFMDVDANLASLESHFDTCEADLAVIPELCTSGYFFHSARKLGDHWRRMGRHPFAGRRLGTHGLCRPEREHRRTTAVGFTGRPIRVGARRTAWARRVVAVAGWRWARLVACRGHRRA